VGYGRGGAFPFGGGLQTKEKKNVVLFFFALFGSLVSGSCGFEFMSAEHPCLLRKERPKFLAPYAVPINSTFP